MMLATIHYNNKLLLSERRKHKIHASHNQMEEIKDELTSQVLKILDDQNRSAPQEAPQVETCAVTLANDVCLPFPIRSHFSDHNDG